ncbi:OPT/YSL family transporter [Halobacillus shinanisalinarum]|uniref:OPT/YSL family transporter n=1 Tax=Halobacillus shinanisalinarum TaxID=2932258 RepID=A0ABY4GWB8_9BACI|nr:OPT/YSL family transporter [Halobacillus shinanisalinarum]UOQ92334.1 OPT/YSL family transporter [Halobacillus shinanisalinarum]
MNQSTKKRHPSAFAPLTLALSIVLSVGGAIIGLQLITTLGISANTSIIGALFAMIIARIPLRMLIKFKSVHRQNLVQTSISAATFGAANSLILPIGIPYALGLPELVIPIFIGITCAMFLDAIMLYKFFDSKMFPAKSTWPPGLATAEAIKSGDEGGGRAKLLGIGIGVGVLGALLKIPMSAFGVAFIGNIWALTMFGIGLLLKGYSLPWFGIDLDALYIPHGFMIGAGIIALVQVGVTLFKQRQTLKDQSEHETFTRTSKDISQGFGWGFIAFMGVALLLALLGGVITDMGIGQLILFLLFAAFAAFFHELIVGISAMHAGWFPAFAVALITLIVGMLIGFPVKALVILVSFSASTGVAFADMGYDLKTGFMLRGNGEDIEFEKTGRRQQLYAALIAFGVATVVVFLTYQSYFDQDLIPPVDRVYATTIKAGIENGVALQLFIWAIPGALLQLIGGSTRQMGTLFATGLLIMYPIAGWTVLTGIIIRFLTLKIKKGKAETPMTILAAGFIAGDAIYNFFNSVLKLGK